MAPILSLLSLFFHFLLHLNPAQGSGGKILFEDGYTVSTVLDGNKVKVNLYSILPQSPFSNQLIVLDSAASTFYTVSLPTTSQESVIKRLAGNGQQGYADGDLNSAMFNKPKSFAVDYRGNVYVVDKNNFAIRKITKSGVTTIAGGYSHKIGHDDGPTRNASFSSDFELVFIPKKCALMVSDRGNKLIRQINLKSEDCTAHSGSGLGMSSAWLLGVGLSCLFGLIVGFIIRPYVIPHEGSKPHHCSGTWNQCLMSLERQIMILCSDIRSVVVSSTAYSLCMRLPGLSLSTLSLLFRLRTVESRTSCKKPVSLMDCDVLNSHQLDKAQTEADQLMNLISFDGGLSLSENANEIMEQEAKRENTEISTGKNRKIDGMIRANIASFAEKSPGVSLEESSECSLSSVKRRLNAGNGFF
ncbi:NHL domain-containing protein [Abeliophyllum distichum]|uniref:NHL domain-containing protein n=1 Tax=Abeliophyllum distichum TaxID=126358 RepID=A0ABD1U3D3_9LAMI